MWEIMSRHTLDKEHVQEDNTAQLKCAEGAVTQTAYVDRSDLGGATEGNGVTFPSNFQYLNYLLPV